MNIFFVRFGESSHLSQSKTPRDKFSTFGVGVNLQYEDLVQYEWNYAEYNPGYSKVRNWDMMLHVNIWKLMTLGMK